MVQGHSELDLLAHSLQNRVLVSFYSSKTLQTPTVPRYWTRTSSNPNPHPRGGGFFSIFRVHNASMDWEKCRAWWSAKQGLDGSLKGKSPSDVLNRSGWARSVGGANPYLTLFSRAGIRRAEADAAVANLQIHELPSARGCTYVLPQSDFALGLTLSQAFGDAGDMATAVKFLGVTEAEIADLSAKVVEALQQKPLDPKELKDAVGNSVRNLGEEGKKRGVTTTLPLALGKLQCSGEIRRVPVNGRLDQQRYKYVAWNPNPLAGSSLSKEAAQTEMGRKYFDWTGPATLANFQWHSGLGVKAAKDAVAPLGLMELEDGYLILPKDAAAFEAFKASEAPDYRLVSSLDSLLLLRRDVLHHIDPHDAKRQVAGERGVLAEMGHLMDLSCNAIVDRGRIVGLWEFDSFANELVWMCFVKPDKDLKSAVEETEAFVRDDLEDCRSFSLDSPESRKPKIEALRKLG